MKKYTKVTDIEVLKKYNELSEQLWDFPYIPIEIIKEKLNTSEYQIRKAYRNLEKMGYMEKIEMPTYCEEYDNGLYTQSVEILHTKVFNITFAGMKKAKESD